MQRTRLNNFVDVIAARLGQWLSNPWRRISLVTISLLFGVFLGTAIPTTSGQTAEVDVIAAGILIFFTELVSRYVYGGKPQTRQAAVGNPRRSLLSEILNALKIGLTYSLFIEAFKLGS
ncbi:DUF565 domain-containing protein [Cyanobacteria bacterium FACHB-472]|nr:DUF565 domain-containing protein [Cyanobacteria bacterium FACHB-472]